MSDDKLRLLIERIEGLECEKKEVTDQIKDVYSEVKSQGYDAKAVREVIKLRKMSPDDRAEFETIIDLYKGALGL